MKYLLTHFAALVLASCAPKFSVVQSTNSKIADPKTQELYVGQNNTITTSTNKVSLNPMVNKDKSLNKIQKSGIVLSSIAKSDYVFGEIKKVEITSADGSTYNLNAIEYSAAPQWIWRNDSQINTGDTLETCYLTISQNDMGKLINSGIQSVRIEGQKRNITLMNDQIPTSFIENLRNFQSGYLN